MISVKAATEIIMNRVVVVEKEESHLLASVGRVLAEPVTARFSLPLFDNSAMDGYAIRSADTQSADLTHPVHLSLIGTLAAGDASHRIFLNSNEAIRIMTGAPIPKGADAVVALEEVRFRDDSVEVLGPVPIGRHLRVCGEDIQTGTVVLKEGHRIRTQDIPILAALGVEKVVLFRPLRAAILATGSELIPLGSPQEPNKIYNSNTPTLITFLHSLGAQITDLGIAIDQEDSIKEKIQQASNVDLFLLSGGASVGEYDLVRKVLEELGAQLQFHRVKVKPGKPLLFGYLGKIPFFGLPGNPISCVVCFLAFIAPFIRRCQGELLSGIETLQARLSGRLHKRDQRQLWVTAVLAPGPQGTWVVTPTPKQGSAMLWSLAQANSFVIIPEEVAVIEEGEWVQVVRIPQ